MDAGNNQSSALILIVIGAGFNFFRGGLTRAVLTLRRRVWKTEPEAGLKRVLEWYWMLTGMLFTLLGVLGLLGWLRW